MRRVRLTLPSLVAAIVLLGTPAVLSAHGALKSSSPAGGAKLTAVPDALRLTFSERVELAVSRIQLLGPDGTAVALSPLRADSAFILVADIAGALRAGTYTVAWQVAGADGHPVRGRFTFSIEAGAAGLVAPDPPRAAGADSLPPEHHPATTVPEPPGFDAESPLYSVLRWLQFAALLIVIGTVAFRYPVLILVQRTQGENETFVTEARRRAAMIGLWATVLLLLSAVARLLAQSYALHGPTDVLSPSMVGAMIGRTTWGTGWMLQVIAGTVVAGGFLRARAGGRQGWLLVTIGSIALAFTPGLSGHASAVPTLRALALFADAAHVFGAAGWLGSLLLVLGAGIPAAYTLSEADRDPAVAGLVTAFSPTALTFAGLVTTSGVFAAWLHLTSVASLWTTTYGQTLLWKLAILSIVAATGAYNWLRVKPALGNALGTRRMRRSASLELGVGAIVLAITAVLVATPTPMDASAMGSPTTLSGSHDGTQGVPATGSVLAGTTAALERAPRRSAPASTPDHRFLRAMAARHAEAILVAHELMQRVPMGPLKDLATRMDLNRDRERQSIDALKAAIYSDSGPPAPTPAGQRTLDAILNMPAQAMDSAFRRYARRHHEQTVATIDAAMPALTSSAVRKLALLIRDSARAELSALGARRPR